MSCQSRFPSARIDGESETRAKPDGRFTVHGLMRPPAHGLQGLHADAAHGLQGLHADAAHGLQGLHADAAHGLQGLQGLHLAAQGLQAHGLQGLHAAASMSGRASAAGLAMLAALITATGDTATSPPTIAAYSGLRANPKFCFELT